MPQPTRQRCCRLTLLVCLLGGVASAAQQNETSHMERFAEQQVRFARAEQQANSRLAGNPNDSKALMDRGVARLNLGKVEEAVEDLRRAAALDGASADARAQFAYGLWLLGKSQEALAAAQAALAVNPDHASAHYYVGRLLLETDGDLAQALQHLQRAVELNPEEIGLHFDLLTAYRRRGDSMRAGVELRLLRAALPPSDPRVAYAEGLLAADRGRLQTAIERFRRALHANPRFVPARYDLGRALVQAERWQEALEVWSPLSQDYPQSYTAAYFHALALQNSQRVLEAEQEARRAIRLQAKSADAHTLLGIALATLGAYADALSPLETAVGLEPQNFDAQFYLGRTRYALLDLAGSRDAFRAATEVKPDDPEARFFLATALEGLGEGEAALAQYCELMQRRPQDPRGYVGLGQLQAKRGQLDEAVTSLRRARDLDPKNFEACLGLGRVLARTGQLEQAIGLLREAAGLAPESVEAHYQLGLALRRAGRTGEATQEFAIVDRLNREYRSRSNAMEAGPARPQERR